MQATPFQAGPERRKLDTPADVMAESVKRTAEALLATGAATEVQIAAALKAAAEGQEDDRPLELLEWVARAQGFAEEHLGPVILGLSEAVATTLSPSPPLVPFAGKLIAPSAFYESFESVHQIAKALMSPVIFAEDTDAIGVASINPIAAVILAEEVLANVDRRFGIKPFLTVVRMDYDSWTFLIRKHFGL